MFLKVLTLLCEIFCLLSIQYLTLDNVRIYANFDSCALSSFTGPNPAIARWKIS